MASPDARYGERVCAFVHPATRPDARPRRRATRTSPAAAWPSRRRPSGSSVRERAPANREWQGQEVRAEKGTPRQRKRTPARTGVALLRLAAPAPALRRLGQRGRAAAPARARRPRSRAQLGLGGARAAPRLARGRARPARPRRQRVGDRQQLPALRLRARPRAAARGARRVSGDDRRALARRRDLAAQYAGVFPERVAKLVAIEGLGPPPEIVARMRGVPALEAHARLGRADAEPWPRASRAATRRSTRPPSACSRRIRSSPRSRRAISRSTASRATRTAPTPGSSTTTRAASRPRASRDEEQREMRRRIALPDAARARHRELGERSREATAARRCSRTRAASRRRRRALGAPRSPRRVVRLVRAFLSGS